MQLLAGQYAARLRASLFRQKFRGRKNLSGDFNLYYLLPVYQFPTCYSRDKLGFLKNFRYFDMHSAEPACGKVIIMKLKMNIEQKLYEKPKYLRSTEANELLSVPGGRSYRCLNS